MVTGRNVKNQKENSRYLENSWTDFSTVEFGAVRESRCYSADVFVFLSSGMFP